MANQEYVYLLWDDSFEHGGKTLSKLHSVHNSEESAEKVKGQQWRDGEYFRIQKKYIYVGDSL